MGRRAKRCDRLASVSFVENIEKIMSTSNSENSSIPDTAELIEKEIELLGLDLEMHNLAEEERATYRAARVMALSALGFIAAAAIATIILALFSNQRELISKASVLALASTGIAFVIAGRRSR
jgi:hypothetical protein